MHYEAAEQGQVDELFDLVQRTIRDVYPCYYPQEVVDSFCGLHSRAAIEADVAAGREGVVLLDGRIAGTGCRDGNHITRVYVVPEFRGAAWAASSCSTSRTRSRASTQPPRSTRRCPPSASTSAAATARSATSASPWKTTPC
nr:hypothetical protein [Eggerthella sinensis]